VRIVTSKNYTTRQAVILLEYAKIIKDPKISAALIDKAADIKDRVDPVPDRSPYTPDVEPRFPDQT
jgi:hypothetical protein